MTNRIRDIRKAKGLTLADLAAACDPPTTAQTIGRLETGMRSLSLSWMNRIGAALGVDPQLLVKAEDLARARLMVSRTRPTAWADWARCSTQPDKDLRVDQLFEHFYLTLTLRTPTPGTG